MWLGARVLRSYHLHLDPGCSLLSSVVLGKSLNLLVPQLSHLFSGDTVTVYLLGPMCGLNEIRVLHSKHSMTVSYYCCCYYTVPLHPVTLPAWPPQLSEFRLDETEPPK